MRGMRGCDSRLPPTSVQKALHIATEAVAAIEVEA